ncbi:MAG: hypothetical protein ABIO71_11875, partial [Caldimonas sp.]
MPSLEGMDDANAVAFIHESYYPDLDVGAVAKAVGYAPPKPSVNQLTSGFGRSFQEVPGMVAGSGAYLADVVGATETRDKLLNYAKTKGEEVGKQHEGDAQSFMDAWDGKTPWVDFLANAAGYVAGQALQSLASGGLGATAARLATRQGAKAIAERAAAEAIAGGATETAARTAASMALVKAERAAMVTGGAVGAGGQNLNMELGSIYPEAVDQAVKEGGTVDDVSKLRVGGSALAAAAVETATEAF